MAHIEIKSATHFTKKDGKHEYLTVEIKTDIVDLVALKGVTEEILSTLPNYTFTSLKQDPLKSTVTSEVYTIEKVSTTPLFSNFVEDGAKDEVATIVGFYGERETSVIRLTIFDSTLAESLLSVVSRAVEVETRHV